MLLRVGPVVANTNVDGERRIERERAAHLRAYEFLDRRDLVVGNLEQQFIVHRQDESGTSPFVAQALLNVDHRDLDDVGVRTLHHEVHGISLAE